MEISISWSLRMYTWTIILKENSKSFGLAKKLFKRLQIEKNLFIFKIHSDHDKDFENTNFFFMMNKVYIKTSPLLSLPNKMV
jgi:hypothetical protein